MTVFLRLRIVLRYLLLGGFGHQYQWPVASCEGRKVFVYQEFKAFRAECEEPGERSVFTLIGAMLLRIAQEKSTEQKLSVVMSGNDLIVQKLIHSTLTMTHLSLTSSYY